MKPESLLTPEDRQEPSREELLRLMADLRIACDNDPTIERRFMLQMARYVFHVVGEWKQKVDDSDRFTCAKVDDLENYARAVRNDTYAEIATVRDSVNLCLKMANHFFPIKECQKCKQSADVGSAGHTESRVN